MQIPFFYISHYSSSDTITRLDEDTSRHIVQVLRMKKGDALHLTDGKGNLFTASIEDDHKKHCIARITHSESIAPPFRHLAIGISPLKNNSRFEWFLEKATELGITAIRFDRGGNLYHGRVKAVADGAREGGLQF